MKSEYPDIESPVDLTDYLPPGWAGEADAIRVTDPMEGTDWKTEAATAKWKPHPKTSHCLQSGCYWAAAELKYDCEIPTWSLQYLLLGTLDDPMVFLLEPSWKDEAKRAMVALEEAWSLFEKTGELPAFPEPEKKKDGWKQNWQCSRAYCAYRLRGVCPGGPKEP